MHIELIDPIEKLLPPLGHGYRPPATAATRADLLRNAEWSIANPEMSVGFCVWKVARRSVRWDRGPYLRNRRLKVDGSVLPCRLLGGQRDWYFVAVSAELAHKTLSDAEAR